jgi:hypothetical protein
MIVFKSEIPTFKQRLKASFLYGWMRACLLVFALAVLLFVMGEIALSVFPFYAGLALFYASFFKFGIFRIYIYEIELDETNDTIIFKYTRGLFFVKNLEYKVAKGNFKINYYRNSQWYPVFSFEQRKPYKTMFNQYCYGAWREKTSMEVLRDYCYTLEYL